VEDSSCRAAAGLADADFAASEDAEPDVAGPTESAGLARPAEPAALDAAELSAAGAFAPEAAAEAPVSGTGSAVGAAGGLLVARSTSTLRVGSGAAAGRVGAGAVVGLGPDSNSGTTNTTNATRIDAPISRSLTRRSISRQYIRDARSRAAIPGTRANRTRDRRCEKIRIPRFDPRARRLSEPRHRRRRHHRRR
jgi:hypothetical protein